MLEPWYEAFNYLNQKLVYFEQKIFFVDLCCYGETQV